MSQAVARVAIVGVSGFSGIELVKLLAGEPRLSLVAAVADRWKNQRLGEHVRVNAPLSELVVAPMSDVHRATETADIVLLATPAEASAELAPALLDRGKRVVDLSGAFRLIKPSEYPAWYSFEHPAPKLLAEACYGLPEVARSNGDAPTARDARLIANPGCYATAAILAVSPLLDAGLIETNGIYLDGKSGVSGAGRKVEERLLFTEVDENLSAYRVGNHQHTPEIELVLSRVAKREVQVTFVPHLLPVRRGLLVTAFARLASSADPSAAAEVFKSYYRGRREVEVTEVERVTIARVAWSTHASVGVRVDARTRSVVAIAALDNLLKGAASQALQNVRAMLGLDL
jgi:N-acetyl-gamma-glutamyl-phosphate reductase